MKGIDLMKGNVVWIVLASLILYAALILFSDVGKISDHFIHIRIELVFLVFVIVISSHVLKIFRQKYFLEIVS
jgi:hypothetical protein